MQIDNEMFESLASEFKQDTGYLAPGKDNPLEDRCMICLKRFKDCECEPDED